jgi:hypothetical protein
MNKFIYNIGYTFGSCFHFFICNLCCCNICLNSFYNFGDGFSQSIIDKETNDSKFNNNEI